MIEIDQKVAKNIVKRVMQIIVHPVNVMDKNGVIIASSDPSRLNQLHNGAVIALREDRPVEITEEQAGLWHNNIKPGINLPFKYLDIQLGVIGISGDPDTVKQYGQLVKMAAELITEQSILLEKERWISRYKEEFISQVVHGKLSEVTALEQGLFFNIDFTLPRIVIVIRLQLPSPELLQKLVNHLELDKEQLVIINSQTEIVLLKHKKYALDEKTIHKKFIEYGMTPYDFRVAIGGYFEGVIGLHLSYKTAIQTLKYAQKHSPRKLTHVFSYYKLPVLLNDFSSTWQFEKLLENFYKLRKQDPKKTLVKTLQQYFFNNCDLSLTAKALFIHPNTLRYRLNKVEQLSGLYINNIDDKFVLYIGCILNEKL